MSAPRQETRIDQSFGYVAANSEWSEVAVIKTNGSVAINWRQAKRRAALWDRGDQTEVNGWCKVVLAARKQGGA